MLFSLEIIIIFQGFEVVIVFNMVMVYMWMFLYEITIQTKSKVVEPVFVASSTYKTLDSIYLI